MKIEKIKQNMKLIFFIKFDFFIIIKKLYLYSQNN